MFTVHICVDNIAFKLLFIHLHCFNFCLFAVDEVKSKRNLHIVNCLFVRNNVSNLKESRLQNGISSATKTEFSGNLNSVNNVKVNIL